MKPIAILVLGSVAVILVFTALMLGLFVLNDATPSEKALIVLFSFSAGLTEICVLYAIAQARWFNELDLGLREKGLGNIEKQVRKMLLIYIPFFVILLAISVWYLLRQGV